MKRGEMLTASEIYKATKEATHAQRYEIMMGKLTPKEAAPQITTARSLLWGTRFEPIAKQIFEDKYGVKLVDTTCIPHPVHKFLGASPDGVQITDDTSNPRYGRLVEFKCPISRDFDESSPVPPVYYHQMQLQMECAGLNSCDYMELKFKEMNYTEWTESIAEYKSVFMVSEDAKDVVYKHIRDPRTVVEWKDEIVKNDDRHWMFVFWALLKYRSQSVDRDPEWLATHLPYFETTWHEILEHRLKGTFPTKPKDKTVLEL